MAETNPYGVKVGQVWQDCDGRLDGRRCMVLAVEDGYATVRWAMGRKTRIRLDRFRPNSTGYRLVSDLPDPN